MLEKTKVYTTLEYSQLLTSHLRPCDLHLRRHQEPPDIGATYEAGPGFA